jgi:hypothetical protein
MKYLLYSILLLMGFLSCTSDDAATSDSPVPPANEVADSNALIIKSPFPLKAAPNEDAADIVMLTPNTAVYPQGEVSEHRTRLRYKGMVFNEPWILVRLKDGTEGWVHGVVLQQELLAEQWVLKQLLTAPTLRKIHAYEKQFTQLQADEELLTLLENAFELRDSLMKGIRQRGKQAELALAASTLESKLPGFVVHRLPEGSQPYYLFIDFKYWGGRAKQTKGSCDDELIGLYYDIYPIDSIEYFCKAWQLETEKGPTYSLLGDGLHQAILRQLDQLDKCGDIMQPAIRRIAGALVNDMTQRSVLYWNDSKQGIKEIEEIINAAYPGMINYQDQLKARLDTLQQDSLMAKRIFNFRTGKTN